MTTPTVPEPADPAVRLNDTPANTFTLDIGPGLDVGEFADDVSANTIRLDVAPNLDVGKKLADVRE